MGSSEDITQEWTKTKERRILEIDRRTKRGGGGGEHGITAYSNRCWSAYLRLRHWIDEIDNLTIKYVTTNHV